VNYGDCCDDFLDHCDGMAAIEEQEKLALAQVASFSVFYAILIFVLLLTLLLWASYALFAHIKKHGRGAAFEHSELILADNALQIALSFVAMLCFTLSAFCYLIANGALGVDYDAAHDTYGNAQIAAIVLWFLGHSLCYALFALKLYFFMKKTTYHMRASMQFAAMATLLALWITAVVAMLIWIDEFHTNYHLGTVDDSRLMACMVIAFAAHIWFCLCVVVFFSVVLHQVLVNRGTTLMGTGRHSPSKQRLEEKVMEHMTRLTVLCCTSLFVTVFCMFLWTVLLGLEVVSAGFLRFCWWAFALDILFSFLSVLLALNFEPSMNRVYLKVCVLSHAFCKFYCVRAALPARLKTKDATQIRGYDDDEDDEENNTVLGAQRGAGRNGHKDDEDDEDEEEDGREADDVYRESGSESEEDSSDSEDANLRGNQRYAFKPMATDDATALKAGE